MPELTTHTGVFFRVRWRDPDESSTRLIGTLEDGSTVLGRAEEGELVPGLPYEFYGRWKGTDGEGYGRQFEFTQFLKKEPQSKHGVVAYLARYAPGVGPVIASQLFDAFGGDAIKILRTQPDMACLASQHLTMEKAKLAAAALTEIAKFEETKVALTNLFAGRGFPGALIEECIGKWGILAPVRIARDPFCLLVEELPGCGFARCDRLYIDLGLPPERLKRQLVCLWHVLHEDSTGSTWIDAEFATARLGQMIGGAKVQRKKAILLGVRAGWLAKRRDANGKLWLAEGQRARNEAYLAEKLLLLRDWRAPEVVPPGTMVEVVGFQEAMA